MKNESCRLHLTISLNEGLDVPPDCLRQTIRSLCRFNSILYHNLITRTSTVFSITGYGGVIDPHPRTDPISRLVPPNLQQVRSIREMAAPDEALSLHQDAFYGRTNTPYLLGLEQSLQQLSPAVSGQEPCILVLLTNHFTYAPDSVNPATPLLVSSGIGRLERENNLLFLPLGIDLPSGPVILNEISGSSGYPVIPVSSSQLDRCFDRLYQLILRILTYAPGRVPSLKGVSAQFMPGQPLTYPAASPAEFAPVVLGWDEIC